MTQNLRFRFPSLVLLALSLFSVMQSWAQEASGPFEVYAEGEVAEIYSQALEGSNLEQFRLRNSRRSFQFEDGIAFELLSAVELVHQGALIDPAEYLSAEQLDRQVDYVFKVTAQGSLAFRSVIDPQSKLAALGVASRQHDQRTIIPQAEFDILNPAKQEHILSNPDMYIVK